MQQHIIKRYFTKACKLGPTKTALVIVNRAKQELFEYLERKKALSRNASISWQAFLKKYSLDEKRFLSTIKERKNIFEAFDIDETRFLTADDYVRNCFDILGSGKLCFTTIPWHDDFSVEHHDSSFALDYFKDVVVTPGNKQALSKDIKIPWELSRFQHCIVLAKAYQKTQQKEYVQTFVRHVQDWWEHNPYLLGPNWVCPMDVGIRALNWIIAFEFFKQEPIISDDFCKHFITSLHDHLVYLDHNWEVYDSRTSNHYLSDLVGYFYLCYFFNECEGFEQKATWCFQELLRECEKQIFAEGADYEGSTRYHALITEIFYVFKELAPRLSFVLPDWFKERFQKMIDFIDWCTLQGGTLIQVGDNDSGKIVGGLSQALIDGLKTKSNAGLKHFQHFGLSVFKDKAWHVSLRHHAYNERQPSGHHHNDVASITVALRGIDLFVDPGSYVYTSSIYWRNYFRSAAIHNTMFLQDIEPVALDERLFTLDIPPASAQINDEETLMTTHTLYKRHGIILTRSLFFKNEETLEITDEYELIQDLNTNHILCWNFTLSPAITVKQEDKKIIFKHENAELAELQSDLTFDSMPGWYSPHYGTKAKTVRLLANVPLASQKRQRFTSVVKKITNLS